MLGKVFACEVVWCGDQIDEIPTTEIESKEREGSE
jgi:hypothetical protein